MTTTLESLKSDFILTAGLSDLADAGALDFSPDRIKKIIERALRDVSTYIPGEVIIEEANIVNGVYEFAETPVRPLPDYVGFVKPQYLTTIELNKLAIPARPPRLATLRKHYEKPYLYTNFSGQASIRTYYNYRIVTGDGIYQPVGVKYIYPEFTTPTAYSCCVDLCAGYYLQYAYLLRNSFRLNELPIEILDTSSVSERLISNALELLRNEASFYAAVFE